jgi:hypothetical protein
MLRRPQPEPAPLLDDETMVVCVEAIRPGYLSRLIERGEWLRLSSPVVQANRGHFAVPLSKLGEVN